MNGIQKVIKYCAMAFAIFLSVVIFGTIVSVVMGVTTGLVGVKFGPGMNKERINLTEEYSLEEAKELDITSILVDCSAEITVKRGDVLAIEAVDVTDEYRIRQTNGEFSIVQNRPELKIGFWVDDVSEREKVVVTIPTELSTKQVKIMSGSGTVSVEEIETEDFIIDSGSGSVEVDNVKAGRMYVDSGSGRVSIARASMSETELDTGSGSVKVEESDLGELKVDSGSGAVRMENVAATEAEVDSGSGSVSFAGVLTGSCEFETGSGSLTLRLDGKEEEYRIKAECGTGTFRINGKKTEDGSYGTNVKGELLIDSGSGSVNVEFNTPEVE